MSTLSQTDDTTEVTIAFRCDLEFRKSIAKAAIDANMTLQQYCQAALSKYSGIPASRSDQGAKERRRG